MKIKVCGMRQRGNIEQLVRLNPDYIGFIFHPQSKRYVGNQISDNIMELIPINILKVGVFVNEPFDSLLEKYRLNRLNLIQLHGNEGPDYCDKLKKLEIPIIKAFKFADNFDFKNIESFETSCDYFLFDTAGKTVGGTGLKFNWDLLNQYSGSKPFFLSGGIGPSDCVSIRNLSHPKFFAVDVNSGFENESGMKDISKLSLFIEELRRTITTESLRTLKNTRICSNDN
jgi:phosphoribosylanthranilate isomerase